MHLRERTTGRCLMEKKNGEDTSHAMGGGDWGIPKSVGRRNGATRSGDIPTKKCWSWRENAGATCSRQGG